MVAISPVFGQLVMFSMPTTFRVAYENGNARSYIREAVLTGETVKRWTQMITVTGHKGLAGNPAVTPEGFAKNMAGGFKKACPDSFAAYPFTATRFDGRDAFIAVVACGNIKEGGGARSETALITVIKGTTDYYTLQWAERGPAVASPPKFDIAKWKPRAAALQPIRLCAIVPGEKAPYPSCVGRK
jgi:hypothetical protein